ncbi:MAG: DUF2442 domain-containing protein [Cyanobacteria bacterium J06588_5]
MVEANVDLRLEAQIEKARQAGHIANATEPRALSAHYDSQTGCVNIQLKSGATYSFPAVITQGLSNAPSELIAAVELTPSGDGLHWEALGADFTVKGLLLGIFGTKAWMSRLQEKSI